VGSGTAGNINLNTRDRLQLTNSTILTDARNSSGGDIQVNTADGFDSGIIILESGDITTNSRGNGGNIDLQGTGIIALDDSDILARSQDARGGNIDLTAFFSDIISLDSSSLNQDGQVDVNADGRIAAGNITQPDTSSIQNSLSNLSEAPLDTDRLLANSCLNRTQQTGRFTATGTDGLPQRPSNANQSDYPTGTVQSIPEAESRGDSRRDGRAERPWQMGDAIVEPQGVYRLSDGRLVMSRECSSEN
jgi:hypothetical protein